MNDEFPEFTDYLGGDLGPYKSWDKVNAPMIRHWCEVMGDNNPIYTDPQAARTSIHAMIRIFRIAADHRGKRPALQDAALRPLPSSNEKKAQGVN